jgi:hypothetical protein
MQEAFAAGSRPPGSPFANATLISAAKAGSAQSASVAAKAAMLLKIRLFLVINFASVLRWRAHYQRDGDGFARKRSK